MSDNMKQGVIYCETPLPPFYNYKTSYIGTPEKVIARLMPYIDVKKDYVQHRVIQNHRRIIRQTIPGFRRLIRANGSISCTDHFVEKLVKTYKRHLTFFQRKRRKMQIDSKTTTMRVENTATKAVYRDDEVPSSSEKRQAKCWLLNDYADNLIELWKPNSIKIYS